MRCTYMLAKHKQYKRGICQYQKVTLVKQSEKAENVYTYYKPFSLSRQSTSINNIIIHELK